MMKFNLRYDNPVVQLVKYALVGVMNTLITLCVIFILKSLLGVNEYVSNAVGYVAGLVNSFLWNKKWVFRDKKDSCRQVLQFAVGFAVCYLLQLVVVWVLTERTHYGEMVWHFGSFAISGYGIATIIGMILYTLANYVYNRLVTFRV